MNQVGTAYGQGLYTLAKEEGLAQSILQQLKVLQACFAEQPEYGKLLSSHSLSKEERVRILDGDFREKVHPYVLNFLKILTEKGYIRYFSDCCQVYIHQYLEDNGILEVHALSAIPLTEDQRERLMEKLGAMTGKKIDLICRVDPAVLGGIRLNFNGKQVDGTLQGRLAAMEKMLKNTVL